MSAAQGGNDYNAVKAFIQHHYRHFNAAALADAAEGFRTFVDGGCKMLLAIAGAMSTLAMLLERGVAMAFLTKSGLHWLGYDAVLDCSSRALALKDV